MISLTENAAAKLRELLAEESDPTLGLRLYVVQGGCHGYQYGMGFDKDRATDDQVFEHHGVQVLVDPLALRLMKGAEIDYVKTVTGEGFRVSNPNAVTTCGCGHSFETADDAGQPDPCDEVTN